MKKIFESIKLWNKINNLYVKVKTKIIFSLPQIPDFIIEV